MLLTNLTLVLGLITASIIGAATTVQNQKNLICESKSQNNYLATTNSQIENDSLFAPKSLNEL